MRSYTRPAIRGRPDMGWKAHATWHGLSSPWVWDGPYAPWAAQRVTLRPAIRGRPDMGWKAHATWHGLSSPWVWDGPYAPPSALRRLPSDADSPTARQPQTGGFAPFFRPPLLPAGVLFRKEGHARCFCRLGESVVPRRKRSAPAHREFEISGVIDREAVLACERRRVAADASRGLVVRDDGKVRAQRDKNSSGAMINSSDTGKSPLLRVIITETPSPDLADSYWTASSKSLPGAASAEEISRSPNTVTRVS